MFNGEFFKQWFCDLLDVLKTWNSERNWVIVLGGSILSAFHHTREYFAWKCAHTLPISKIQRSGFSFLLRRPCPVSSDGTRERCH